MTGQSAELTAPFSPRPQISHVVFDFDGTLSWLRHGWPELMAGLFLKHMPAHDTLGASASRRRGGRNSNNGLAGETRALPGTDIHDLLLDDILSLNGKSSIYQMERCAQRVLEHGGPSLDPSQVLEQDQAMLLATVRDRAERLRRGETTDDEFVVCGARKFLEKLRARGLVLIILSGSVEHQVKQEADLLGLAGFFGAHIYGGTANLAQSSKQAVVMRILSEEKIAGEHLLSFGDGPVEIGITKSAGGLAVGVASDEDVNGSGKLHPQKLPQLRKAGADLLIPDYLDGDSLLECLFGA